MGAWRGPCPRPRLALGCRNRDHRKRLPGIDPEPDRLHGLVHGLGLKIGLAEGSLPIGP